MCIRDSPRGSCVSSPSADGKPATRTEEMTHNPFQKKLFGAATLILAGALAAGTAIAQAQPAPGRLARGIRAAKATRDALKAVASAATPDPAAVGAAFLKVRADGQAAAAKMKAVRTEIDAVLTPEQRAKLDGWIAAHRQQRAMFRGGPPQN